MTTTHAGNRCRTRKQNRLGLRCAGCRRRGLERATRDARHGSKHTLKTHTRFQTGADYDDHAMQKAKSGLHESTAVGTCPLCINVCLKCRNTCAMKHMMATWHLHGFTILAWGLKRVPGKPRRHPVEPVGLQQDSVAAQSLPLCCRVAGHGALWIVVSR